MATTITIRSLIHGTARIMAVITIHGEIHGAIHIIGLAGLALSAIIGATHGTMAGVAISA
jgi:hypothetical protein